MAFDDDQILQDYIARLLNVQDTREALLDETDLQAAARDLGLSDRDLARAEAIAEAHRQRGKNFSRHDAWDEAIAEFRQAMVLDPFDVPLLHELAVAGSAPWLPSGQVVSVCENHPAGITWRSRPSDSMRAMSPCASCFWK